MSSLQLDMFYTDRRQCEHVSKTLGMPDADVQWYRNFFDTKKSDSFYNKLFQEIPWQQQKVALYQKVVDAPRLSAWYEESDNKKNESDEDAKPFTPLLREIHDRIYEVSGIVCTMVGCNLYRNGNDGVGYHSDDDNELETTLTIVSVTFGATRRFMLRHKFRKDIKPVEFLLAHGSVLIQHGHTQKFWEHSVPKTAKPVGPRISLTYRVIT